MWHFLTTGPGELVGWSGLVSDGRMTATAMALDDTTLIAMSGQKLRDLCASEHDLGNVLFQRVAQVLSKRLLSTRLQLLDLFEVNTERLRVCGSPAEHTLVLRCAAGPNVFLFVRLAPLDARPVPRRRHGQHCFLLLVRLAPLDARPSRVGDTGNTTSCC